VIALRLALGLLAGALVLFGGAFAGGALGAPGTAPVVSRSSRAYDRPSSGGEIEVGDALEVNGQPMRLSLFYTADPPARVIAFYTEAFLERKLLPITSTGHVAAFDPEDGQERFISALAQPGGQTLVLVGTTNPRRPPRLLHGADHATFPVPPGSSAFLGYRSEDAGARTEAGQFVCGRPATEIAAFYRRELAAQGFREHASTPAWLDFERSGETLSVGIQALDDTAAAVFVNRLQGDATR
jgi:hypothetical protein